MDRDILPHLPIVAAVARRRSFAAAAAELGLGRSAVSHAVRLVEERLQVRLFARTTRSVSPTEAGAAFMARTLPALDAIRDAAETLHALKDQVRGVLRINAPRVALPLALAGLIAEASHLHPRLTIEVTSDDALVDIVREGFDAGIRLGEMIAGDMVAVRLTPPFRAIMVAAPAYLDRMPPLRRIADLRHHNCIGYRLQRSGGLYAWELSQRGRDVAVDVRGTVCVTDSLFALELARAGIGIAYLFEPLARADLASGALSRVLPATAIEEPGLFLYFPRRAAEAPKLRALIELARRRP